MTCPTCGSDDPAMCGKPWPHPRGTYDLHVGEVKPCCPDPFHAPSDSAAAIARARERRKGWSAS